jgi:glycosyltransferase involved in cell wall biosynthesis
MKNSLCLFTVIYPGCEPWLPRFFESVNRQTRDDFDLMILNDGVTGAENLIPVNPGRFQLITVSGTIAGVRQQGINLLMDSDYDKIIFADADDFFSDNRIEKAAEALETADIYVNDLTSIDEAENLIHKNYFSSRLGREHEIEPDFILRKNIMGLGNSAVRKSMLREIDIPDDTIAADWLIFTDMMLRGCSAIFNSECVTFYRQHDNNTAGFKKKITPQKIEHALSVQLQNAAYFSKVSSKHKEHYENLKKLSSHLNKSEQHLQNYMTQIEKTLPEQPFWWEEIKILDELNTDL